MSPVEPIKFLLVDDVEENLTALEALLKRDDLELVKARSGPEALELLLVHEFALALLDVQMPGMDGFELAELMRSTERTRRIPIIFMSAVATDERRLFRGYEAGAVDYLLKPVDTRILSNKTDLFFELARQRRELAQQRDELSTTAESLATALGRLNAHGDNSPLAIVEFDSAMRLVSWSKGAERMFGWEAAEVLGRDLSEFRWIHEDDIAALRSGIGSSFTPGTPRGVEAHRCYHRDGTLLDCEWYGSVLMDAGGRPLSLNAQILDVTGRKRSEEMQHLLIGELNHRVKNTLASIQAIASQTLRHAPDPADFAAKFSGRLQALARAHSILSNTTWKSASLHQLFDDQAAIGSLAEGRLVRKGPAVDLPPQIALHFALVLHELTTNANKYGALSAPTGRVEVHWSAEGDMLHLRWQEIGGPPVRKPDRSGFGSKLIERSLRSEGGSAAPDFAEDGVKWDIRLPIPPGSAYAMPVKSEAAPQGQGIPAHADPPFDLTGKKFLVVEDEPLVAFELATILEEVGVDVIGPVGTADEAQRLLIDAALDGVLLDGNLHGDHATRVADELEARRIPYLFVTGYGPDHLPGKPRNVAVIAKPFQPSEIVRALSDLVVARTRHGAGQRQDIRASAEL